MHSQNSIWFGLLKFKYAQLLSLNVFGCTKLLPEVIHSLNCTFAHLSVYILYTNLRANANRLCAA